METVKFEIQEHGVAKVVLNRPEKKNAFNADMIRRLREIAVTINGLPDIRLVNLMGEGDFFCAGADLGWMKKQTENTPEEKYHEALELSKMLKAWYDLKVPVLSGVQGGAFGGGLGLVVLSDEVIGVKDTRFSFSEVKLGLIPATISPYVQRTLGNKIGNKLLLSGRKFSVQEAKELGLVDEVVALKELESVISQKILLYLEGSPAAVKATKKLLRGLGEQITDQTIEKTVAALTGVWAGKEAKEGVGSYFLQTKPSWSIKRNNKS